MAVYTHPPQKEIQSFVQEYAIGQLNSVQPIIHGVENSNFVIQTSKGTFILTIYEKRMNEKDLRSEVLFLLNYYTIFLVINYRVLYRFLETMESFMAFSVKNLQISSLLLKEVR